ncbi:MAG TPA: putative metal-dependent hydrolase [Bryobacteraceae bacterium]|nr:putative metal-dependent hydrolase [Bryobacteraceae bacterium]
MQDADLRYPIGPLEIGPPPDAARRAELLADLGDAPASLRATVSGLSRTQLDTPYRLGGWTVRQVVHHLADAHMNWYVRTRLALTEDRPVIKVFDETTWAELPDARSGPVETSLDVIDGLHSRWVEMFRALTEEQWKREMLHPERGALALDTVLQMLVWHLRHHTAHITELRKRLDYSPTSL